MSISAGIMGLLVLLIRKIKRIPRRILVFLWIVPFFRMCMPIGLNNPYSLMSVLSRFTTKTITVYQLTEDVSFSVTNFIMEANSYFPITYKVNLLDKIFSISAFAWLIVALAILIALGILYFTSLHEIKDAKHLRGNIYLSKTVQSPAVYGILKPKIILPIAYASKNNRYILKHEMTHIRRLDNLWRMLAFFLASIHWFNPLSWIFLKLFLSDLELACDETAIMQYNEAERKEYARSLLESVGSKSLFVSSFGGAKIRVRIENVLSFKRMTWIALLGFSVLIVSIIIILLTNAG